MSSPRQVSSPRRRSAGEWQQLLQQFAKSGLSGPQFCKAQQIPYPTFQLWRQRLATPSAPVIPALTPALPFVELSRSDFKDEPRWHITLKLGNGVELCLSQG